LGHSDVSKSQVGIYQFMHRSKEIEDMVDTAKNSDDDEVDECEYDMTPSQARKISYDGHSATEPERVNKK